MANQALIPAPFRSPPLPGSRLLDQLRQTALAHFGRPEPAEDVRERGHPRLLLAKNNPGCPRSSLTPSSRSASAPR